ncbi:MAG: isoprenylcysteine carboxylmethyltransferase family protein [Asticcacaulis sp.]|uniref:methyltransferase family protein n=1 Tax=Asticcacaulis sp. TaxID=1872648 RepID=UPI0039E30C0C
MAIFMVRIGEAYLHDPTNLTTLLLLISEAVSLIVFILARRPFIQDHNAFYMALAIAASFLVPLFIQAPENQAIAPKFLTFGLAIFGGLWTIFAKVSLGRSFGILAANRTVKIKGAYKFLRHPIYVGYFAMDIAFLLDHFVMVNFLILVTISIMQVLRALREEQVLSKDESYRSYCQATPYRFIYGVF